MSGIAWADLDDSDEEMAIEHWEVVPRRASRKRGARTSVPLEEVLVVANRFSVLRLQQADETAVEGGCPAPSVPPPVPLRRSERLLRRASSC